MAMKIVGYGLFFAWTVLGMGRMLWSVLKPLPQNENAAYVERGRRLDADVKLFVVWGCSGILCMMAAMALYM